MSPATTADVPAPEPRPLPPDSQPKESVRRWDWLPIATGYLGLVGVLGMLGMIFPKAGAAAGALLRIPAALASIAAFGLRGIGLGTMLSTWLGISGIAHQIALINALSGRMGVLKFAILGVGRAILALTRLSVAGLISWGAYELATNEKLQKDVYDKTELMKSRETNAVGPLADAIDAKVAALRDKIMGSKGPDGHRTGGWFDWLPRLGG